jgi:predicted transcriptional regulator YdeE
MESRIVVREETVLAGMSFFGNPFSQASAWDADNEIGALWKRFLAFLADDPGAIGDRTGPQGVMYELHAYASETARTGRYEVFAGIEVLRSAKIPVFCSLKIIPAGEYVLVTARGAEIREDWTASSQVIAEQCLGPAGRTASSAFVVEVYDRRFKGMDRLDESELDFLVPLEAIGKA